MKKFVLVSCCLLSTNFTLAATKSSDNIKEVTSKITINLAFGAMQGLAHEYVYDEGRIISELDWKFNCASIFNYKLNYDFYESYQASLNGWFTMAESKAVMDDYDWMDPLQSSPTDWSHHNKSQFNTARDVDVSLTKWLVQRDSYKIGLTGGYKNDEFNFVSYGGYFVYDNGAFIGTFPDNIKGISYKQEFETLYIGLAGKYFINKFEFGTELKFGPLVGSYDEDYHHLRNLIFYNDGGDAKFYSANLNAGYDVNEYFNLFLQSSYNVFTNTKADTTLEHSITRESKTFHNAGGLDNQYYYLALGVRIRPDFLNKLN